LLADVEVVLGELTAEVAGHRDRGDVVQGGVEAAGQIDDGAGALDIGGAAVHDVVDGAEVADQGFRPDIPGRGEAFEAGQRAPSHQDEHLGAGVAGQQLRHHAAAYKPGTAGNDIAHLSIVAPGLRKVNACRSADIGAVGLTG
jgi:hypothetical protein